ncbi:MAG: M23 family metallopeptidase [Acidimicrobiia bacterium]|nr:M23 family metallopeptidase [Acidimicrobiia bacterium]NNF09674.1 M23 family metallopeptidase [Acidimicrobiia bacterium]NNL68771.1 M23 family metallopeptidase [Acidimicrobiia bacterium]
MLRLVAALAVVAAALAAPPPAAAEELPPPAVDGIYPLVFPVGGDNHYTDTWGAPRSGGRTHEGVDILADKMVPVVAAASGTIGWVSSTCCALEIDHDDGWSSMYIHLNNDTPGTDDGQGWGIMPGLERGVHVEAGQLIGWVGDSGNAEWTSSHLHFELHAPQIGPINPTPHVDAALGPAEGRDVAAFVDAGSRFHRPTVLGGVPDRFYFGVPEDVALMGDWDCDGVKTPAMYRPSNGYVYLTNENAFGVAQLEFYYGIPGDIPLAGDWDGNGCDSFAIYRPSEGTVYARNSLGTGFADFSFDFGVPGDQPFAGDFNGDGIDTVGMYRPWNALVYYRNANTTGPAEHQFFFGAPGDRIVAGDWDGDGDDSVAVYRPSIQYLIVNMENNTGPSEYSLWVGSFEAVVASTGS